MKRRSFIAGIGGGIAGAFSGCIDEFSGSPVTETFSTDHAVDGDTTVTIGNRNGPVTVRPADGDRVTVFGTKRANSQEGLDSITVDVVEGQQFVVNVRFGSGSDLSNRSVDLTVELPERVALDRATTANGNVSVAGISGDLTATSSNGDVDVTDVSGYVHGETSNGDVQIRETTGVTRAHATNGTVDVELHAMRGDVTCSSSNGDVSVGVGPDVAAAIRLSTSSGTVTVRDLQYTATEERRGYVSGSLREGDAPLLRLRTTNGDVTLRPV